MHQICNIDKYIELCRCELVDIIKGKRKKDKNDLIVLTKRYFCGLIYKGYSREFLYVTTKKYFNNFNVKITSVNQIDNFFEKFNGKKRKWEFLVLLDLNSIEYIESLNDNLRINLPIEKVDITKERVGMCKGNAILEDFFKTYDKLCYNQTKHQKISIIRYKQFSLDYFSAMEILDEGIKFIQSFSVYFKHHPSYRQIYKMLLKLDENYYIPVKTPNILLKRPYIMQGKMDMQIEKLMSTDNISKQAFDSLTKAIVMHAEALDSQNTNTLIKSLWTSLESLFSSLGTTEQKLNVTESVLAVIQKTYILKSLRTIYSQINDSLEESVLKEMGIDKFSSFLMYFVEHAAQDMKSLYDELNKNPLLRTRIFNMRITLNKGKSITQYLSKHEMKIRWQLQRIYRTRNMATHLGIEVSYSNIIVNHLHNYFDFFINYLLCKICNDDYVCSISTVVWESKNDNNIHKEMLKGDGVITIDNYREYLFGPDKNLMNYEFEQ